MVGVAMNFYDDQGRQDMTPTEGNRTYAIIVCIFASLGGIFFGYDQGVTGGVLVMESFLNDFCVGWHGQTMTDCTRATNELPQRWVDYTLCARHKNSPKEVQETPFQSMQSYRTPADRIAVPFSSLGSSRAGHHSGSK
ncbi:Major Facilitator Superfamily (MFS) [Phytophthora cinnamomi]|uniref:Major Facilitator Superfamily (MFS) n=1 Tax=Phytophthora cinnamomi TaxID=4785 RepID=UPI00355A4981|nr:Major Facilitator Superfamily (MFS) [Phytophthora cinnamomi]